MAGRTARSVRVRRIDGAIELVFELGEGVAEPIRLDPETARRFAGDLSAHLPGESTSTARRGRRLAAIDRIRGTQQEILARREGRPFSEQEIRGLLDEVRAGDDD